jgi:malate synthase
MTQRTEWPGASPGAGVTVLGKADDEVLPSDALALIASLSKALTPRLHTLLRTRKERQARLDSGAEQLEFLSETASIRAAQWRVAAIPNDLLDRRVEITGPAEAKMIINALSSGAQVFMADFEDSLSPTWTNVIEGQRALKAAVRGTLTYDDPKSGKHYSLPQKGAVLMARPRGLHLPEHHITLGGAPIPASFFDAALYLFHNARALLEKGSGPYLYLPKLESHHEAALWSDALALIEDQLKIERGSVKVTCLIETLPAAFEMDEILYALQERIVGLNCGRWDYIFSTIKRRRREPGFILPDRATITMDQHFLRSYTQLLIKTCHRRGAFAMGGMSAFIPRKDDAEANAAALEKVRQDKRREANDGHDGTWVAHPGLVETARAVFDAKLGGELNQMEVERDDVEVSEKDLLAIPTGARTEAGLRHDARVGVEYLAKWLAGLGCVPISHLMEDAATAEISRTLTWHWLHTKADVEGKPLTEERVRKVVEEETAQMSDPTVEAARSLFLSLCLKPELEEFLTLPAYELLLEKER